MSTTTHMQADWNTIATAQGYEQSARDLLHLADSDVVLKFWLGIQGVVRNAAQLGIGSDVLAVYNRAVMYAGLAHLPLMVSHDALELFSNHLTTLLDCDSEDVADQLKRFLIGMDSLDDRNAFKEQLREVLLRSAQVITREVPGVPGGTAGSWISFMVQAMGGDTIDSLKAADFFTNNPAVHSLTPEEHYRLEHVVDLFAQASTPSDTPEGMEDELVADDDISDEITIYNQQGVQTINKKEDPLFTTRVPKMLAGLQHIWLSQAQQPTPLEVEADTFAKESGMTEAAAKAVLVGPAVDVKTTVAALRVYAQEKSMEDLVAPWHPNAVTAPVVCAALRKLLIDDLKLADVHAAAIVWRLVERLTESDQHKYRDLVYYDMESGYFHWNEAYMPSMEPESPIA